MANRSEPSSADDTDLATYELKLYHLFSGFTRALKLNSSIPDAIMDLLLSYFYPGRLFQFESTYDRNGILYWLGTKRGVTQQWINPSALGVITVTASQNPKYQMPPSAMVTRRRVEDGRPTFIGQQRGVWFMVDFGETVRVKVTHYSMEHQRNLCLITARFGAIRGWNLEGSNDGNNWVILKQHEQDTSLSLDSPVATWSVDGCKEYYRFLKIQLTQAQEHGLWELTAALLEVYGYFLDLETIC